MKFLFLFLLTFSAFGADQDCTALITAADSEQDTMKAKATALKAISVCSAQKIKSARPYMVLCDVSFREGDFASVVKYADAGLKEEPGLGLAYMNKCAAYSQMKKFSDAISSCKKGLEKPSEWSAKLNSNLGLAIFSEAVTLEKFNDTIKAEPYFLESSKLDPSIAQNFFYLGTIEEMNKNNPKKGAEYFGIACNMGHKPSCESKIRAEATATAPNEDSLWAKIEDNYRKKGIPAEQARKIVTDTKAGLANVPKEQRPQIIKSMLESSK